MNFFHTPALLKQSVESLNIKRGSRYIDATIGGGGHAVEILKRGGVLLGIDVDQEAIEYTRLETRNLTLVRGNFKDIGQIARSHGFDRVAGILFDLGVSSHQLQSQTRGFSFKGDAPLDMRMDRSLQVTAADLVNGLTKEELYELFTKLADEPNSWAISNNIIRARKIKPITKTSQLADIVIGVYKKRSMRKIAIHPATKVFQALRIAVNDELNNLKMALPQALDLLDVRGRLVVISFHSLEDRIVKQFGKEQMLAGKIKILTDKPIVPDTHEITVNPRARSAKMRVFQYE